MCGVLQLIETLHAVLQLLDLFVAVLLVRV